MHRAANQPCVSRCRRAGGTTRSIPSWRSVTTTERFLSTTSDESSLMSHLTSRGANCRKAEIPSVPICLSFLDGSRIVPGTSLERHPPAASPSCRRQGLTSVARVERRLLAPLNSPSHPLAARCSAHLAIANERVRELEPCRPYRARVRMRSMSALKVPRLRWVLASDGISEPLKLNGGPRPYRSARDQSRSADDGLVGRRSTMDPRRLAVDRMTSSLSSRGGARQRPRPKWSIAIEWCAEGDGAKL